MKESTTLILFLVFIASTATPQTNRDRLGRTRRMNLTCTIDDNCGAHGFCRNNVCRCEEGYITWQSSGICAYKQRTQLVAFLVSFLAGSLGADWFVLARGNSAYIFAGICKLFMSTGYCVGLPCIMSGLAGDRAGCMVCGYVINILLAIGASFWWLADWIRILTDAFDDGNGAPLRSW